jgi:hypothetical protein
VQLGLPSTYTRKGFMSPETVMILGRFTVAILALIAGVLFVYWGVKLYIAGLKQAGSVDVSVGKAKLVLTKAAPGSFLGVAGVAVIVGALMTMPRFKTTNTMGGGAAAADSVHDSSRAPAVTTMTEIATMPTTDTIAAATTTTAATSEETGVETTP